MRARHNLSLAERLDFHSIPEPNSGCQLWTGGTTVRGYGRLRYKGTEGLAHRWSWEDRHGVIPFDLCVCHRCDVPSCINPNHLFLGTDADNVADMVRKGRQARGTGIPTSKLTHEQVRAIRRDKRAGHTIAAEHGVHRSMVNFIRSGALWAHLPDEGGMSCR